MGLKRITLEAVLIVLLIGICVVLMMNGLVDLSTTIIISTFSLLYLLLGVIKRS